MADVNMTKQKSILSLCATTSERIKDLVIKDGQLIFIHDIGTIAMDFKGKRTFYNQVIELQSEKERESLSDAINGKYYFVIESGVFYRYYNGWIQLTSSPNEIVHIGDEYPGLGEENKIYINKIEREIAIWDDETNDFLEVANYTGCISAEEISALF